MADKVTTVYSRGPVVRRETVKFARAVSRDGLSSPDTILRFEREVLWVRESEAKARTVMNGRTLNEGPTHNDFYGLFTSPRDVIRDARSYAESLGMVVGGEPRREVEGLIFDTPYLGRPESETSFGRAAYYALPRDWFLDDQALEAWVAEFAQPITDRDFDLTPNRLDMTIKGKPMIWRSDLGEEDNAALLEAARAVAFDGVEQ